jgi:hypothetical protein
MPRIHSYVVRYDSGFAPNPFYGFCTLATCKPDIRRSAQINDWVVGSGSNERAIRRGGHIVYAMRVTEAKNFREYDADPRFEKKRPYRYGSRKQSCGDSIYYRKSVNDDWCQRDSFHTLPNGDVHPQHIKRDTGVDRVLISDDFVYFGGEGPQIPAHLKDRQGRQLCKSGIGRSVFEDPQIIDAFVAWFRGLGQNGYQGAPFEWMSLHG